MTVKSKRADVAEEHLPLVQRDAGAQWLPTVDPGKIRGNVLGQTLDRREGRQTPAVDPCGHQRWMR